MSRRVGIVGTGQTKYTRRRADVNLSGLVREAVQRALDDAELTIEDIDAVVVGSAPEFFEGVNFPEQWLTGATGAVGKTINRIHTGGSVGGSTGITAFYHVASGMYDVVLAVCFEKLSDGVPQYGLSVTYDPLWGREFAAGAPGLVAMQARQYMARYPLVTEEHFARTAVKDRRNALKNPYAHLQVELSMEDVLNARPVTTPLKLHDCCPASDGAAALIFATEDRAKKISPRPAWVRAVAACAEGAYYPGMDIAAPASLHKTARKAYQRAGITDPVKEFDMAEVYVAFSPQEIIWAEGLSFCGPGEWGQFVASGRTEMDGEFPINPSGGVLSSNPIGASALIRQLEAALQVMGKAGEHQIPGVKRALAHGWGGWLQFHTVMILEA